VEGNGAVTEESDKKAYENGKDTQTTRQRQRGVDSRSMMTSISLSLISNIL
jgi:hypothetical protein